MEKNFGNRDYRSSQTRGIRQSWRAYQAAKRRGADSREQLRLLEDWRARVHVKRNETAVASEEE